MCWDGLQRRQNLLTLLGTIGAGIGAFLARLVPGLVNATGFLTVVAHLDTELQVVF